MHSAGMMRYMVAFIVMSGYWGNAYGQECPAENPKGPSVDSAVRVVKGVAVFHNGLRRWMELRTDRKVCGTRSVQLFAGANGGGGFEVDEGNSLELERLRGCRLELAGRLGLPGTGYYSAPVYMNVERKKLGAGCLLKSKVPVYWNAKPKRGVKRYRVEMRIRYSGEGNVTARVTSGDLELKPWQAYANYWLTGNFAFYGNCAKGYGMTHMRGTRAAHPDQIDEQAALDPESAAQRGVWNLYLNFTCTR